MKNTLLGGIALSAMIAFAGAAYAQAARDSAPGTGATPGAAPQTGQAPGLQQNQQDAPKGQGQPSGRAQERTGMDGDRTTTKPGDTPKPGAATGTKPADTTTKPEAGTKPTESTTKPGATTGTKPADTTAKPSDTTKPDAGAKPTDSASKPGEKPAADAAKVDLKPEQQTQLRQRITSVNVRTVSETQLNVTNISVGVVIPRTVELVVIPNEIVEIVPQFRGYRIIRVGARYLIVHPETYRIVYIITV